MQVILNFDKTKLNEKTSNYEIVSYIRRAVNDYGEQLPVPESSNMFNGIDAEVIIICE